MVRIFVISEELYWSHPAHNPHRAAPILQCDHQLIALIPPDSSSSSGNASSHQ